MLNIFLSKNKKLETLFKLRDNRTMLYNVRLEKWQQEAQILIINELNEIWAKINKLTG